MPVHGSGPPPATPLTTSLATRTGTLAFVESPVQLLNVLEWAHRSVSGRPAAGDGPQKRAHDRARDPVGLRARSAPPPGGGPAAGPAGDAARGPVPAGRSSCRAGGGGVPGDGEADGAASRLVSGVPGARAGGTAEAAAEQPSGQGADRRPAGPAPEPGRAAPVTIVVLSPTDPMTRGQLRRMTELARDEGHQVRWEEARGAATAPLHTVRRLAPLLRAASRIVVGDPFSRYVQLLLVLARSRDLVVVDDGTATMEFVAQLARSERLVRWHRRGGRPGPRELVFAPVSACARRRLTPGRGRSVQVFSAMPIADVPAGVSVTANDFGWTRARFGPPTIRDGADLVGTSLVETGVVDLERYLTAVGRLARAHGATRYFAHRREDTGKLRRLAAETGLEIVRPDLPLELTARRGPVSRTVLSFPSTVVHTLPPALTGTGVRVAVCDIDPDWLTDHASPRAEGFLAGVTGTARGVQRVRHPASEAGGEQRTGGRPAPGAGSGSVSVAGGAVGTGGGSGVGRASDAGCVPNAEGGPGAGRVPDAGRGWDVGRVPASGRKHGAAEPPEAGVQRRPPAERGRSASA